MYIFSLIWQNNFVELEIISIFALAFESESCKQEKHCDTILSLKIRQINEGGLSIFAFA